MKTETILELQEKQLALLRAEFKKEKIRAAFFYLTFVVVLLLVSLSF